MTKCIYTYLGGSTLISLRFGVAAARFTRPSRPVSTA